MKPFLSALSDQTKQYFDTTATWVTQISWAKFLLLAILILAAGSIMQETLFSSSHRNVTVKHHREKSASQHSNDASDRAADIQIDASGIRIHKYGGADVPAPAAVAPTATTQSVPAAPAVPLAELPQPGVAAGAGASANATATTGTTAQSQPTTAISVGENDIHIRLPPGVGKDVQDAIDEAVNDATAQQLETYREKSSEWFMNFVLLLVIALFGTKALMGGKKRAEANAAVANASAEREALQRQVSEARLQTMQAQVEPHFLFNTLASVEHLIETDPPRAAKMQNRLIQYLRAVLPQMRDSGLVTTLGREGEMVSAYLDLLKMRMEERLTIRYDIPAGLRSAAFPPMMLQSLVENAIKHGLESKPDGGSLSISAEVADNKLRVSVTDTGLGFGVAGSSGTGLGLQNIRERLSLLHGQSAQLIIAPNVPTGVIATIEVPYRLAN